MYLEIHYLIRFVCLPEMQSIKDINQFEITIVTSVTSEYNVFGAGTFGQEGRDFTSLVSALWTYRFKK